MFEQAKFGAFCESFERATKHKIGRDGRATWSRMSKMTLEEHLLSSRKSKRE